LLTHTALTESGSFVRPDEKLTAFLELDKAVQVRAFFTEM